MQAIRTNQRTWRFPRLPLVDQLELVTYVWAGAAVFAMAVVIVVSFFRSIEISAWEIANGAAPWFVGILSGWVMFVQVPLFIANGRTRRDSFIEWAFFAAIYPVWTALLTTIGYLVERVVYGVAGWPLRVGENHLFNSHTDIGRMFIEYVLTFFVWVTVGGFVGVSLYRSQDWGWFSLIPAGVLVTLSGGMAWGEVRYFFGLITRLVPAVDPASMAIAIPMALVGAAVAFVGAWFVVRDMPLRNT